MNMEKQPAKPGDKIAYRGDGTALVYDYTDPDGMDIGHIVMPNGASTPQAPLMSILARGYWTAQPNG